MALEARYEIRQGQFDKALHSLQDGMAMAQHVARPQLLVNRLISMTISDRMLSVSTSGCNSRGPAICTGRWRLCRGR